ncbi:MAG: diguanylate cyclase [bacterium]|nr:diguanylate cyclase [bacterium]
MKEGVRDFIVKPFEVDEIVDAIDKVIKEQITFKKKSIRKKQENLLLLDEITGVYNKDYFFEALDQEIRRIRRYKYNISLLLISIDGFDKFNKEQGTEYGDKIINKIGQIILENVREVDIVGRISKEEFGVLLLNAGDEKTLEVAERIKLLVEGIKFEGKLKQKDNRFIVSIGMSFCQPGKELMKEAQLALKKVKR